MQSIPAARLLLALFAGAMPSAAAVAVAQAPKATAQQRAPLLSARQLQELDRHIESACQQWQVPGVAVAIVQGDSIVFAKGYGVREMGKTDPVTERTLFGIGSNGKTFTSALTAMMVDEGKLRWDDPIWKYLPRFRVSDPYVSQNATVRDALSHRVGVTGPVAWYYGAALTPAELIDRLRFIGQETPFRARFNYSNAMIMVAGEATAAVAGRPWGDLLEERIFAPLGMTESVRSGGRLAGKSNVASAHMTRRDGSMVVVPNINGESMAPAGALFSTALDMAQFLRLQLGNGSYRGKRLISERSIADLRSVVTPTGGEDPNGRTTLGYGLGWFVGNYRGHKAIWHGGGVDGMLSDMQILLDDQVGVVVLTNQSSHSMHSALTPHIFDIVLGLSERDWNAEAFAQRERQKQNEAARWQALEAQRTNVPPAWPLERYAGRYADSLAGEITVAAENGKLVARYHPGYAATLEPWQYNTFRMDWRYPSAVNPPFATFHQGSGGGPAELEVTGVGRFRRRE